MFEKYVYTIVLASGKRLKFSQLITELGNRIGAQGVTNRRKRYRTALSVIGAMIASGDIGIDDDGNVYIS